MSEPLDPSISPPPALPMHSFDLEDFRYLRAWKETQPTQTTWDQRMHALAKHLGIEREQLPAEPPSRLN